MSQPAVRVVDLSKRLALGPSRRGRSLREAITDALRAPFGRRAERTEYLWALRNVDLEVAQGEVVGIIGRNGAGKSTLLRILSRISEPTSGHAEIRGSVASLLEVGTGFHPELSGRENVFLNGAILGMRRAEIQAKFDEIVAFAAVEDFLDTPVKRYSSGMRVRLAFAVAAHLEPDVLIIDEVLAVGDVGFRNKCLGKMGEVARSGRSVLFVSHSMPAVEGLCSRALLLDAGRVVASGAAPDVIARYFELNREPAGPASPALGASADGSLRVRAVEALSPEGEPLALLHPGRSFVVRVVLEAERPLERAVVQLALNDALGTRVAVLSSRTAGRELSIPAGRSAVHCVVHDPPLAPASYGVDLQLALSMEPLLFQRDAATFTFAENDYYKSGSLPAECTSARCLVRQTWDVEPDTP